MRWIVITSVGACQTTTTVPTTPGDTDSGTTTDTDTPTTPVDTDTPVESGTSGDTGTPPVVFSISSPDMAVHGSAPCMQQLPMTFWCAAQGGTNLNPELSWTGAPKGTMSFALTMEDASINFLDHWGVYNIDPTATGIARSASGTNPTAKMPAGAEQINPYAGSCSNGQNTYRWRLFALDATIDVNVDAISDIDQFAMDHALGVVTMCHCPENNCEMY